MSKMAAMATTNGGLMMGNVATTRKNPAPGMRMRVIEYANKYPMAVPTTATQNPRVTLCANGSQL